MKVHSANKQVCVNGAAKGMALKDSTAANPMPLRDYLTELKSFLQDGNKLSAVDPKLADFTNEQSGIFDGSVVVEALTELGAKCE